MYGQDKKEETVETTSSSEGNSKNGFQNYGWKIVRVDSFKYLGSIITEDGNDFLSLRYRIRKARARWMELKKIIIRKGENPRVMMTLYCSAVIPVLLYCSETWTLTKRMKKELRAFHNGIARDINRLKFVAFWIGRYGCENINWIKVRQNDEEALRHIHMKSIEEYWLMRTDQFWMDRYGHIPRDKRPLERRFGEIW